MCVLSLPLKYMYPPLLTIFWWHILSNYRLGVVSAPLEVLRMAGFWSAAPSGFLKWTTFVKKFKLFEIFILGTFRWGHFFPPFLDLLFTCIDTIDIYRCWVMTHILNLSFPLLFPYPTGSTTPWKKNISYFQTKPKKERDKTSRLKSHPLHSPQWVTLQSLTFLSLWKISSFHINQKQRFFSLSHVWAKTQSLQ